MYIIFRNSLLLMTSHYSLTESLRKFWRAFYASTFEID